MVIELVRRKALLKRKRTASGPVIQYKKCRSKSGAPPLHSRARENALSNHDKDHRERGADGVLHEPHASAEHAQENKGTHTQTFVVLVLDWKRQGVG